MGDINYWAVLVAGLSSFMVGGLWYSPALFGKAWMSATGLTEAALAEGNPAVIYGLSFVLAVAGAFVFALFLGPEPELSLAVCAGFFAGLVWVAGSFGINYLFERKSLKLFAINGGYHTAQYTVIGAILGLWP